MKRILTSVVLLVLLFPGLALSGEVKYRDLVKREGLHYKKFTQQMGSLDCVPYCIDVPFTGKTTGRIQGTFRHGKKHGPWVSYYKNGQLLSKGTYKNGKEDGLWVHYHEIGQLSYKGTYKNGKWDGPWVGYNEDGTVFELFTGTYKDGKKVK